MVWRKQAENPKQQLGIEGHVTQKRLGVICRTSTMSQSTITITLKA
jgi:hypothetical protein